MKKRAALMLAALLCLPLLYGCGTAAAAPDVQNDNQQQFDVVIGEEYYVTTVTHILDNFADYEGRTVSIEGAFQITGTDTLYRMVFRQDLSC